MAQCQSFKKRVMSQLLVAVLLFCITYESRRVFLVDTQEASWIDEGSFVWMSQTGSGVPSPTATLPPIGYPGKEGSGTVVRYMTGKRIYLPTKPSPPIGYISREVKECANGSLRGSVTEMSTIKSAAQNVSGSLRALDKTELEKKVEIDEGISQKLEKRGGIKKILSFGRSLSKKKSQKNSPDREVKEDVEVTSNRLAATPGKSVAGNVDPSNKGPKGTFLKAPSPPLRYPSRGVKETAELTNGPEVLFTTAPSPPVGYPSNVEEAIEVVPSTSPKVDRDASALSADGHSRNYRNQGKSKRVRHRTTSRGGCNCQKSCESFCRFMCCCYLIQAVCEGCCGGGGGGGGDPCAGGCVL